MSNRDEAIRHFEALQKRYTKQHNGTARQHVKAALEALRTQTRLESDLAAMTAERDAMRERAKGAFGWAETMFERLGSKGGNEAIRYSYSRWRDEKWRGPDAGGESGESGEVVGDDDVHVAPSLDRSVGPD